MILLDTDILSLFLADHPRASARHQKESDPVVVPIVARIEVLQGRFDTVLKASDGLQLQQAQRRLDRTEARLVGFPVVPIDETVAAEFDRLREIRSLRSIGRADLLIAAITLANRGTLATRNLRHFRLVSGLRIVNWAD